MLIFRIVILGLMLISHSVEKNEVLGAIGNSVFVDSNANGIKDVDDWGIEGAVLRLYDSQGILDETETDMDGYYSFENLPLGWYTVVLDDSICRTGSIHTIGLTHPTSSSCITTGDRNNHSTILLTTVFPEHRFQNFGINVE